MVDTVIRIKQYQGVLVMDDDQQAIEFIKTIAIIICLLIVRCY
jgi:hypothetical protein